MKTTEYSRLATLERKFNRCYDRVQDLKEENERLREVLYDLAQAAQAALKKGE